MDKCSCLILACLIVLTVSPTVVADRGMIGPGDISVYEPGQKAIIAWDGEREVLILSTEVRASENSWVLELLPLPSQPTVGAGDFESFSKIQQLLWEHATDVWANRGEMGGGAPLEVIFQENIGAHSITVVRATSAQELISFAENLWAASGLTQELSWGELESLAAAYIGRGINYWVLDLINPSNFWKSIQPIVYTFETNCLYFPLEISSLTSGETDITLFTLTNSKLDANEVENIGFSIASFTAGEENVSIEFEVSENELQQISPKVAELFEDNAWLTALTYSGPLGNLRGDIRLLGTSSQPVTPSASAQPAGGTSNLLEIVLVAAVLALELLIFFGVVYKRAER